MFDLYRKIKAHIARDNGLNYSEILSFDIAYAVYFPEKINLRSLLWLLRRVRVPHFPNEKSIKNEVLFTIGEYGWRTDYQEIINNVRVKLRRSEFMCLGFYRWCFPKITSVKKAIKITRDLWVIDEISLVSKCYIFARCTYYINSVPELELTLEKLSPLKYVSFSSAHTVEALTTLLCKRRGIVTYTLQHGVAHVHPDPKPIDSISYENFISDFQLCWGEYSRQEYISFGIDPARLLLAGCPREVTSQKKKTKNQVCLVFLAREAHCKLNSVVLKYISDIKAINFLIKPHPSLSKSEYQNIFEKNMAWCDEHETVSSLLSESWLATLSVNTSAYYESLASGDKALVYTGPGLDLKIVVPETGFSNIKELNERLFDIQQVEAAEKDFVIGASTDNYSKILENDL